MMTGTGNGTVSGAVAASPGRLLVLQPTALFGAFLICGSAAAFAYANYREVVNIIDLIDQSQVAGSKDAHVKNRDDNEDYDDDDDDSIDGGSSAFGALTHTLSRRQSSSLGGSVIMLSSHSLRVSLDGGRGGGLKIKPLLLVSDADLWGENLMRFDEFVNQSSHEQPQPHGQPSTTAIVAFGGSTSSAQRPLLGDQHDETTTYNSFR
jgi:hypothetical protein